MQESTDARIPVLTDVVGDIVAGDGYGAGNEPAEWPTDIDTLVAELQTRLAADTFALAEQLMRSAFAEMEAALLEQISSKLRQALPELIDSVLRDHLYADPQE